MSDLSETEKAGVSFTWKIENFLDNVCESNALISPEFVVRINEVCTKWHLLLYPNYTRDYMLYYHQRVDDELPKKISANFKVSCITADGKSEVARLKHYQHFEKGNYYGLEENTWNWERMFDKKSLYFPNGNFIVRFQMESCPQFAIHPAEYLAVTHLEVTNISFHKDVHDFHSLGTSLKFSPALCNDLETALYKKETSKYLSVEFRLKSQTITATRLGCKLSVQNSRGITLREREDESIFNCKDNVWKFPDFIKMNELIVVDHYFENPLHLRFDFRVHSGHMYSRLQEVSHVETLDASEDELCVYKSQSRELEALYSEKRFTDVEIRLGQETFSAHKFILRVRSPVFDAMFDHDMVEKETSVVQIEDVDAVTFENMLAFMYSGAVKNMDENMATKLLSAADKYQVLTLKKMCATFLKNIISTGNACLLLQLADSHHEESLQKAAQEFICDHHRDILSSDEWRLFIRSHGDLASEVIQKLSVRYTSV